jgi:hypothetical protein
MTAVIEDTDLDWVVFSEEEHEIPCERGSQFGTHDNVALYRIRLHLECGGKCGAPTPELVCLPCKDEAMKYRTFHHSVNRGCFALVRIIGVEPLR